MILESRGVTCRIDDKQLLDGVDFTIEAGRRYAVIGPNGAGKSTLLKALCRIMPISGGGFWLDHRPLDNVSRKELARWISYVPPTAPPGNGFTVQEFVLMGRYPHLSPFSSPGREDHARVTEALAMTGMQAFAQRRLETLSGGEQQKIMIAAAMVQEARIMLLDEPTAFLDPKQQDQVYALLETIRERIQVTLIEVTHDVNRAALSHDIIFGLRDGKLIFQGAADDLMQEDVLAAIYDKRFIFANHPENGCRVVMPGGGGR